MAGYRQRALQWDFCIQCQHVPPYDRIFASWRSPGSCKTLSTKTKTNLQTFLLRVLSRPVGHEQKYRVASPLLMCWCGESKSVPAKENSSTFELLIQSACQCMRQDWGPEQSGIPDKLEVGNNVEPTKWSRGLHIESSPVSLIKSGW